MFTDQEIKNERTRQNLLAESAMLSEILVEIECSSNFTETHYQIMDRIISKRQNEIEQELIMLGDSDREESDTYDLATCHTA